MVTMSDETQRRSDVSSAPFEPWPKAAVHLEWGHIGAVLAAERNDVCVIVDVLSFSTTMSIATEVGAVALSYSGAELDAMGGRDAAEKQLDAVVIGKERAFVPGRYTLSPASLKGLSPGERVVFTSLNGALCVTAASTAPALFIGSLRNRRATANAVARLLVGTPGLRCTVIACGEQWTSFSQHTGLRPSIEDWLGAGAIASALAELGHPLSAEAELAAASFESQERRLIRALSTCVSGRELIERGFDEDVLLAAELDAAPVTVRRADDDNERAFIAH